MASHTSRANEIFEGQVIERLFYHGTDVVCGYKVGPCDDLEEYDERPMVNVSKLQVLSDKPGELQPGDTIRWQKFVTIGGSDCDKKTR